jgi:hypothetical protein
VGSTYASLALERDDFIHIKFEGIKICADDGANFFAQAQQC